MYFVFSQTQYRNYSQINSSKKENSGGRDGSVDKNTCCVHRKDPSTHVISYVWPYML